MKSERQYLQSAKEMATRGDLSGAISTLNEALSLNPNSHFVHEMLGVINLSDSSLEQAVNHFTTAATLPAQEDDTRLDLGVLCMQLAQPKLAKIQFEKYIKAHLIGEAMSKIGILLYEQGFDADAENYLRKAHSLRPYLKDGSFEYAMLLRFKSPRKAERLLRRVLRNKPNDALALAEFGALLTRSGRTIEAEEVFLKSIAIDPKNADARIYYAFLLADLEEYEAAEREHLRACEVAPNMSIPLWSLGKFYLERGKIDAAEEALLSAVRVDPSDETARRHLHEFYSKHETEQKKLKLVR